MIGFLLDALSWAFLVAGGFFVVVGAVGLLRMPEFFTRMHAAGVTDTLGSALVLTGLMLQSGFAQPTVKLVMILLFVLLTSPTATHALAKAALHGGIQPVVKNGNDQS